MTAEDRTFHDWQTDARNSRKSATRVGDELTRLGRELRDRWDDWKQDAPRPKRLATVDA